jgi:hypothetical protein
VVLNGRLPEGVILAVMVHHDGMVEIGRTCDAKTAELALSSAITKVHADDCDAEEHQLLIQTKMPNIDWDGFLRSLN